MEDETAEQLRRVNWFVDLPDELFSELAQKVRKRALKKGEVLFNKGDEGSALFIINAGRVNIVTQDPQDHEVVLNQVGAGEIIGEMALLDYEPRSAGVTAIEETVLMELSREDFLEILAGQPNLALTIIRSLISRLRHNTSYIENITNMSRRVAQGDYSFLGESQSTETERQKTSEEEKIERLMAEFYAMVKGVREREEELKEQLQKLELQIDERKRKQVVDEIKKADFYSTLKKQAQILRAQRKDNK